MILSDRTVKMIKRMKRNIELVETLRDKLHNPEFKFKLILNDLNVVLEVYNYDDLKKSFKWIKEFDKKIHYTVNIRFYSSGTITDFTSKEIDLIIRLKTSIADYPQQLKSDKCCWRKKEVELKKTDYSFVCENNESLEN